MRYIIIAPKLKKTNKKNSEIIDSNIAKNRSITSEITFNMKHKTYK